MANKNQSHVAQHVWSTTYLKSKTQDNWTSNYQIPPIFLIDLYTQRFLVKIVNQVRNLRAMQEGYLATMSFFVYNHEKKISAHCQ